MRVIRYMSRPEYAALLRGELLENHNVFNPCWTTSVGFCFLRKGHYLENYLVQVSGQMEECIKVEFEVNSVQHLCRSKGKYFDQEYRLRWMREYCTECYSIETFKIIKAERVVPVDPYNHVYDLIIL